MAYDLGMDLRDSMEIGEFCWGAFGIALVTEMRAATHAETDTADEMHFILNGG